MLKRGSADGLSEVNAPGHCGLVNMSSVIEKQEKPDASKQNPMNHLLERRGTSVTVRQLQLYDSSLGRWSSVKLSILVDTSVISISASDTNLEHLLIWSLTMCAGLCKPDLKRDSASARTTDSISFEKVFEAFCDTAGTCDRDTTRIEKLIKSSFACLRWRIFQKFYFI